MPGVIYKVKLFSDLKNNMEIFNISPEEGWKLIYGQKKLDLTKKSIWKMQRFQVVYRRLSW